MYAAKQPKVHFGTASVGFGRTASCNGRSGLYVQTSNVLDEITCKRCRNKAIKAALAAAVTA